MYSKSDIIDKLNNDKIKYQLTEHEALFTVKDSNEKRGLIEGAHTKNLFLKNKKNNFFLFSCLENTKIDLKKLGKSNDFGNISFAQVRYLQEYLGLLPGAVTPFGLLNDSKNKVVFFLDEQLTKFEKINFHPLVNTSTITINLKNFISFLIENNKKVNIFNFDSYSIVKER